MFHRQIIQYVVFTILFFIIVLTFFTQQIFTTALFSYIFFIDYGPRRVESEQLTTGIIYSIRK